MSLRKKVKGSIRNKLYAIFFIIIGVSALTMIYQYYQIHLYSIEVAKQKNIEHFLLVESMVKDTFEFLDRAHQDQSAELKNKTNTLYNLMLNDAFAPVKGDLKAAKVLISSNLEHGAFDVQRLSFDGKIVDSSVPHQTRSDASKAWMKNTIPIALHNPGKIYVSPLLLDLNTQMSNLNSIVVAPNQKEFIHISHSEHLPNTISTEIRHIKADFPDLKALQIFLIDHLHKNIINIRLDRSLGHYDYDTLMGEMKRAYKDCMEDPNDQGEVTTEQLIGHLKNRDYICDSHEDINIFYAIDHSFYETLGNHDLLIKATLAQKENLVIDDIQQKVFYSFLLVLVIIMYFYYVIRKDVVTPLEKITEATFNKIPITDHALLNNHNEISSLAKSVNFLNHKLSRQIHLKNRLLEIQKTFISNTIHEVSTPLNVIGLNVDLLEMQYGRSDPIKFIVSGLRQIRSIKDDISYVMLAGDMDYTVQEIELCSFLQERIEFFNQMAWANDKSIVGRCDQNTILKISVTELSLLINNNISNAIKYSTGDKEIKIEAVQMGRTVRLSFSNAGKAIINTKRIFQRFYREDNERRGFGIGLNIVYNICKKNHIHCEARSEAGRNTFTYQIPLEDRDEDITA